METYTNKPRSASTFSNRNKQGVATWDDPVALWDDPMFTWDNSGVTAWVDKAKQLLGFLLQETASYLLLEDGSKIVIGGTVFTNRPKS